MDILPVHPCLPNVQSSVLPNVILSKLKRADAVLLSANSSLLNGKNSTPSSPGLSLYKLPSVVCSSAGLGAHEENDCDRSFVPLSKSKLKRGACSFAST